MRHCYYNNDGEYTEQRDKYSDWIADFAIILNDDFKTGSAGICGQYLSTGWEYMTVPTFVDENGVESEINPAGTCYFLMYHGFGGSIVINYELLVDLCSGEEGARKGFNCGAYNLDPENIGKSITVQLRLYKPNDDGSSTNYINNEYVVCKEIVCTFYN